VLGAGDCFPVHKHINYLALAGEAERPSCCTACGGAITGGGAGDPLQTRFTASSWRKASSYAGQDSSFCVKANDLNYLDEMVMRVEAGLRKGGGWESRSFLKSWATG
jgi:hypothetical protein